MQWLLDLIAKHTKDGVLNNEALIKEVNTEFPKHAVPKSDFNELNEQLKTANGTIADLKKNNTDNEALQNTIKEHEQTISGLKADAEKTKKEYTLKEKLRDQNVTDPDYLIYKHGGVDKFTFDKDGNPIGLEDTVKPYKESIPHIFKAGDKTAPGAGAGSGYKPKAGQTNEGGFGKGLAEAMNKASTSTENPFAKAWG